MFRSVAILALCASLLFLYTFDPQQLYDPIWFLTGISHLLALLYFLLVFIARCRRYSYYNSLISQRFYSLAFGYSAAIIFIRFLEWYPSMQEALLSKSTNMFGMNVEYWYFEWGMYLPVFLLLVELFRMRPYLKLYYYVDMLVLWFTILTAMYFLYKDDLNYQTNYFLLLKYVQTFLLVQTIMLLAGIVFLNRIQFFGVEIDVLEEFICILKWENMLMKLVLLGAAGFGNYYFYQSDQYEYATIFLINLFVLVYTLLELLGSSSRSLIISNIIFCNFFYLSVYFENKMLNSPYWSAVITSIEEPLDILILSLYFVAQNYICMSFGFTEIIMTDITINNYFMFEILPSMGAVIGYAAYKDYVSSIVMPLVYTVLYTILMKIVNDLLLMKSCIKDEDEGENIEMEMNQNVLDPIEYDIAVNPDFQGEEYTVSQGDNFNGSYMDDLSGINMDISDNTQAKDKSNIDIANLDYLDKDTKMKMFLKSKVSQNIENKNKNFMKNNIMNKLGGLGKLGALAKGGGGGADMNFKNEDDLDYNLNVNQANTEFIDVDKNKYNARRNSVKEDDDDLMKMYADNLK